MPLYHKQSLGWKFSALAVEIKLPPRYGIGGGFEVGMSVRLYKGEGTSQEILVNPTFDCNLRVLKKNNKKQKTNLVGQEESQTYTFTKGLFINRDF